MANYILDNSGNISHIKYNGQWVGQVNYKAYGASSPTRLSWQPQHTTINGWFNNSDYHWQNCDICRWQFGIGTHEGNYGEWGPYSYSDINATSHAENRQRDCILCGFAEWDNSIQDHVWNIKGTWIYNAQDDTKHYRTNGCICGHVGAKDSAAHGGSSTWEYNNSRHYHNCTTCSHVWAVAPHIYAYTSVSRTKHDNHCSICNWNILEAHTDGTAWYKNADNHWHQCTKCGNDTKLYSHTWSNTNTNIYYDPTYHNFIWNNRCSVCDYNIITDTLVRHVWSNYTSLNNANHKVSCVSKGCTGNKIESHDFNNYALDDNNHRYYCIQECGFSQTVAHDITYFDEDSDSYHRKACIDCNYLVTQDSHNYNQWGSWSSWRPDNDVTCYRTQNRRCYNCSHLQTNIQRNNHNWHNTQTNQYVDTQYHNHILNNTCVNCSYNVITGTLVAHSGATSWTNNGENHWHICTACAGKYDIAAHSFGSWGKDATFHWYICGICSTAYNQDRHGYGLHDAWVKKNETHHTRTNYCQCGATTVNDNAVHHGGSIWLNDTSNHWHHCAICQNTWASAAHSDWTYTPNGSENHIKHCGICEYHFDTHHNKKYTYYNIDIHNVTCNNCTWNDIEYHNWSFEDISDDRHRKYCLPCGNTHTEAHHFGYENYSAQTHYKYCTNMCGYNILESHTWSNTQTGQIWNISNTQHNIEYNNHCAQSDCGYAILVNVTADHHLVGSWAPYNGSLHKKQCDICQGYNYMPHANWTNTSQNQWVDVQYHNFSWHNACGDCSYNFSGNDLVAHSGATKWTNNASSHWHICSSCSGQYDIADHVFDRWGKNTLEHWYICGVCSRNYNNAIHNFNQYGPFAYKNATHHTHSRSCICGQITENADGPHHGGSVWDSDATNHWHYCTLCSHDWAKAAHGDWTYYPKNATLHYKNCGTCEYSFEVGHDWNNTFNRYINISNTQHNIEYNNKCDSCSYNQIMNVTASHSSYGSWTDYGNTTYHRRQCGLCSGYNYGTHSKGIRYNSIQHWQECSSCTWTNTPASHTSWTYNDITTSTHRAKCGICAYNVVQPHDFEYTYYNENAHLCDCHSCQYSVYQAHHYIEGRCEHCGAEEPPSPPC